MGAILRTDSDDLCNPLQRSFTMPLWQQDQLAALDSTAPGLAHCIRTLLDLPAQLESQLQLPLRVPQQVMIAAYPPGAHYRQHLDSYDGVDIPRLITVLLYLGWEPAQGGQLRVHTPDGICDIDPLPGRMVVFMSQEILHEVLVSAGERFALTLWIWDRKQDTHGR